MSKLHSVPTNLCFGCGNPMKPEQGKNGGWCVRCPGCRQRVRRYEHQKNRRRAENALQREEERGMDDIFHQTHPYFLRWLGHDCDKLGC